MAVVIDVSLLTGSYDAAEVDNRGRGEWPPHPARLFSALVSAARTDKERKALYWLENQRPPVVHADEEATDTRREAYVVTNKVDPKGGNLTHPGRTNGLRARARTLPASPKLSMVWAADAEPGVVTALDAMARRVPYLGRSTGVALLSAGARDDAEQAYPGVAFEPCELLEGDVALRVPYSGFLDALDEQYEADRPAWEVSRTIGYRRRRPEPFVGPDERIVPSVYSDIVIFGFAGLRPDGRLASRFTDALRSAVLRRAGRDAPEVLHGHGADGRPHVAYIALPDVGGPHSDGHLLGLAVAIPDVPAEERRAIVRAVLGLRENGDGPISVKVPALGAVELIHQPGLVRPWGVSPERWRQGSRRWVSATPVVLDRYPKKGRGIHDEVIDSLRRVGLPDPVKIRIARDPLQRGAVDMRPNDLPDKARGKLYRHVDVTFDRRVSGPVLLGAGRYLGVGLFAPAADREGNDA